ncbi:MAG: hypothetical protein GY947_05805 [Rhodobacteraceae bacterium]|nr:hypothetical protein [Paracoccaceae bacterium]
MLWPVAVFNKAAKGDVSAARLIAQLVNTAAEISGKDCDSEYSEVDLKAVLEEAEWQVELVKLKQETSDDD